MPNQIPAWPVIGATPGAVPVTPTQNHLNPNHVIAPYLQYTINVFYVWNNGILQIPIAKTPPTFPGLPGTGNPTSPTGNRVATEIVTTSAPFGKKIIQVRAKRRNALPVMPDPTPTNTNETLLSAMVNPQSPVIMPDMASRIFIVTAEYVYALAKPYWIPDGQMTFPVSDADGYSPSQYTIGSIQFVKGLIQ